MSKRKTTPPTKRKATPRRKTKSVAEPRTEPTTKPDWVCPVCHDAALIRTEFETERPGWRILTADPCPRCEYGFQVKQHRARARAQRRAAEAYTTERELTVAEPQPEVGA